MTEATILAKYISLLTESSNIISHFGKNINPALRKAVIQMHQNKDFSHEAGAISQVDKVTWSDVKGKIASDYSEGRSIAIVGDKGAAIIRPSTYDGGWKGVVVSNDMAVGTFNDSSVNRILADIKPVLGKAKEFYSIRYKKTKN